LRGKEDVDKLIDFASKGSLGAKVQDLDVKWQDYGGEFRSFEICY